MSVGALTAAEEFIWNITTEYYYSMVDYTIYTRHATFLIERHDGEHMPYHVYYRQAPVEKNTATSIVLAWMIDHARACPGHLQ